MSSTLSRILGDDHRRRPRHDRRLANPASASAATATVNFYTYSYNAANVPAGATVVDYTGSAKP